MWQNIKVWTVDKWVRFKRWILVSVLGATVVMAAGFTAQPEVRWPEGTREESFIVQNAEGAEAVGILLSDGTKLDEILAKFEVVIDDSNCQGTSTPKRESANECEQTVVMLDGRPVNVYAIAPSHLETELYIPFPFSGTLVYPDYTEQKSRERIVDYMAHNGNKEFKVIYEK